MANPYGFTQDLPLSMSDTIAAVTSALAAEGFGVLTEIDVKATLQKKLGVGHKPYMILGACNPQLAYQGLQVEPELGLLLPCNVIVYDNGNGTTTVSIVDPIQMLGFVHNDRLEPIAEEANVRLQRVHEHLGERVTA